MSSWSSAGGLEDKETLGLMPLVHSAAILHGPVPTENPYAPNFQGNLAPGILQFHLFPGRKLRLAVDNAPVPALRYLYVYHLPAEDLTEVLLQSTPASQLQNKWGRPRIARML